ncbi:hypothetical protein [Luteolibacter luteus]|uniref:Uncharacterized protein n=1 Tax=Luteolibacter luteus TaxID=2728835 RepID=A0A858RGM1_9BACT|nr:hypothetical protein [Luteolibacter luteus]QJE95273.1 hypothetical protein HHL09_05605 [Luteolibacter luteus]
MNQLPIGFLAAVLIVSLGVSSCDSVDEAVNVVERGIDDITSESNRWQTVLKQVANDLPKEVSETIRQDAQQLATRSIAQSGVEFRCNTDFLGDRAIQSLQRLRSRLDGSKIPPLSPAFCHVSPDTIDLKASPDGWSKVTFHGYDMDSKDKDEALLGFDLVLGDGSTVPVDNSLIDRTTHYQVTVRVRSIANQLHEKKVSKIRARWQGYNGILPEVGVLEWQPRRKPVSHDIGRTSYMPPKVGRGDRDFSTHDDEHMSVQCQAELRLAENGSSIQSRVNLWAKEQRRDWTEVSGWSDWATAYSSPQGWRIVSYRPNSNSQHRENINSQGKKVYSRPGGEVVSRFEVWGDQGGDEAGTWTKVEAFWRPIDIEIEEELPAWLAK